MELINPPNPGSLTGAIGAAVLLLVNVLTIHKEELATTQCYPNDRSTELETRFDFIIVGAGTAGCILANRLSENSKWKVLLIEAGDYPSLTNEVPAFYHTLSGTIEDWQFVASGSNKSCLGMLDNVCKISKGKVLGGTSTIGNLHYTRTNPKDFRDWFDLGNKNWNCEHLSFFNTRVENYTGPQSFPVAYGREGDIPLELFQSQSYVKDMIWKAAAKLGYGKLKEGKYIGYAETAVMAKEGMKVNMAKAFLTPIRHRQNLYVLKRTLVTRVLFSGTREKRAAGVECLVKNNVTQIRTKREVILSAGAINTPALLMLSGLGSMDMLSSLDIPVLMNLPVGFNLQIHFGVPVFVGFDRSKNINELQDIVDATYQYLIHKKGPLTNTNINDLVGFVNTNKGSNDFPNVVVYHHLFAKTDLNLPQFLDTIGYVSQIKDSIVNFNQHQNIIMFVPTIFNPKSTGTVFLQSKNPAVRPTISANFLKDEEDLLTLVSAFRFILKLTETANFKLREAEFLHITLPNCKNYFFDSVDYTKCYVQNMAFPQSDVAGTTKMGPKEDACSVVDENLLVKNILGLRVVDASIMPKIVSANIQATMAMIADRMSERIKDKWIDDYIPEPKNKCSTCKQIEND